MRRLVLRSSRIVKFLLLTFVVVKPSQRHIRFNFSDCEVFTRLLIVFLSFVLDLTQKRVEIIACGVIAFR